MIKLRSPPLRFSPKQTTAFFAKANHFNSFHIAAFRGLEHINPQPFKFIFLEETMKIIYANESGKSLREFCAQQERLVSVYQLFYCLMDTPDEQLTAYAVAEHETIDLLIDCAFVAVSGRKYTVYGGYVVSPENVPVDSPVYVL